MKIGDKVHYDKFPHENDVFIISGDKNNPLGVISPTKPGVEKIDLEEEKDFIIVKEGNNNIRFQVKKDEITITS